MSWRVRRDISTARNIPCGMMDNKFATLQPYAISSQNTCPRQALCRGDIINLPRSSLSSFPSILLILPIPHPYPPHLSLSSSPSITLILPIYHSHPPHPSLSSFPSIIPIRIIHHPYYPRSSSLSALSIILIRPTSISPYAVNTAAIQSPPSPSFPSIHQSHT